MTQENKISTDINQAAGKVGGMNFTKVIPFIQVRWQAIAVSIIIIVIGLAAFVIKGGFKIGLDFQGGARVQVKINNEKLTIQDMRRLMAESGFQASVNTIGAEEEQIYQVTTAITTSNASEQISANLAYIRGKLETGGKSNIVELRGSELVQPKEGQAFAIRSFVLLAIVSVLIMLYVALRFDFAYAMGGIIALFHDMLIMMVFALLFEVPLDITIIAALLTILGFSINDTIVIFDRIRELFGLNKEEEFGLVINRAVTQTLSRTFITSLTTFFVALAIWLWSGEVLKNFGFILCVGIISGTYSSVFIAAATTYMIRKSGEKKPKKAS